MCGFVSTCADFNICTELCGFSIKNQILVISVQIFISKENFISLLNTWIPTSYLSLCPTVEEMTMWQVGCLRAWWVAAECRRKVKKIMFIVDRFILFSVVVLSVSLNLMRRWRFEYWNAIMIIFKFWWRSLWKSFKEPILWLFYE